MEIKELIENLNSNDLGLRKKSAKLLLEYAKQEINDVHTEGISIVLDKMADSNENSDVRSLCFGIIYYFVLLNYESCKIMPKIISAAVKLLTDDQGENKYSALGILYETADLNGEGKLILDEINKSDLEKFAKLN